MKRRFTLISVVCFTAGFLLIFLASYFELLLSQNPNPGTDIFGIMLSMLKSIGIALITSTFVNGLKYYFETAENLVRDGYFNRLTREEIKDIRDKMESKLYFEKNEHDKDNFYSFFVQELSSLLNKCYYKKYDARIECHITGEYIKKIIHKRFEIINPSQKPVLEIIPFDAYLKKVEGIDDYKKLFKIQSFKVDLEDRTQAINRKLEIQDTGQNSADEYCIKVSANYEFKIKKSCIVDMVIETTVPLTDIYFTNYVTKPCKEYNMIFVINDESYNVNGYIFGLVETHKDKLVESRLGNGIELGFRNWILPGDGVVFAINKIK